MICWKIYIRQVALIVYRSLKLTEQLNLLTWKGIVNVIW